MGKLDSLIDEFIKTFDSLDSELQEEIRRVRASKTNSVLGGVRRSFSVGDWVVYKPFENCREVDISGEGEVIEDLGDGMYKVTFGYA